MAEPWCKHGYRWGNGGRMQRIRVLIADDHPLFRDGIHGLLDSVVDMDVVGEASTTDEVIRRAADLRPDIILMDIKMPGGNGIIATREILAMHPTIGILMITMFEDDDSVFAAMRAGARGYVLKDASYSGPLVKHTRSASFQWVVLLP